MVDKSRIIWHDRKRNGLGLPWTFTVYDLSEDRLFVTTGILNKREDEVRLYRVVDTTLTRSLWQRIIGTGCVEMVGSGGTSHQVHCIEQPMKVRKIICASIKKPMPTNSVSDTSLTSPTSPSSAPNTPSLNEQP